MRLETDRLSSVNKFNLVVVDRELPCSHAPMLPLAHSPTLLERPKRSCCAHRPTASYLSPSIYTQGSINLASRCMCPWGKLSAYCCRVNDVVSQLHIVDCFLCFAFQGPDPHLIPSTWPFISISSS